MEDMHIHLKDGIKNQDLFDQYINMCINQKITKAVFLDHGNRISTKHIPVLCSKEIIDEFNNRIIDFNTSEKSKLLKVIRGIEIDYSKDLNFRTDTLKLLNYGDFEWIVGAIHSMKFSSLKDYLEAVIDMINNYTINVVAHLKLDDTYKKYEEIIIEILKMCSLKNIFIEINTSDRSRWTDEQLFYMLDLMDEYGVDFVMSSDAHKVDEIGYMIDEVIKKVKKWKKSK